MKLNIRTILCSLNAKQLETLDSLETNKKTEKSEDSKLWRDFLAYWILGLTSEFGYVLLICAAHDILHGFDGSNVTIAFF